MGTGGHTGANGRAPTATRDRAADHPGRHGRRPGRPRARRGRRRRRRSRDDRHPRRPRSCARRSLRFAALPTGRWPSTCCYRSRDRAHFEAASEADVVVTFWGAPEAPHGKDLDASVRLRRRGARRARGRGRRGDRPGRRGGRPRPRDDGGDGAARPRPGGAAGRLSGPRRPAASPTPPTSRHASRPVPTRSSRGTRFLMSDESGAHPAYKERSREAGETILTELFGVGWPAQHRVIPNEATARWLRGDPRGPGWLRGLHAATAPFASRVPVAVQIRMRHRSGRAGRCSAPRPRPSGGRRLSRPGRSTPGSASTGSMTSAPPASSSASWPVSRFRARAGLSRRGRRRR